MQDFSGHPQHVNRRDGWCGLNEEFLCRKDE